MLLPTQDKEARLTNEETIKITDSLCKNEGIVWGDWSIMAQGNLERHIIDIYEEIINAQIAKLEKLGYHKGLPPSIEESLNSGDGVYRP